MENTGSNTNKDQITNLLQFAQTSYASHPTDALSALMQALTLASGPSAAQTAMNRIRHELGDDIAQCIDSRTPQPSHNDPRSTQRAMEIVSQMMQDETTLLYQQGRQHLLQQAMEDGSSVVCDKCNMMIKADRWEQHLKFWCSEAPTNETDYQDGG